MMEQADANSRLEDLETLLLCRNYLYTLFAKLCGGEPCREFLEALVSNETIEVVQAFAGENTTMNGLVRFLGRIAVDGTFLNAAKDEFTKILIGPASLPAQPLESPYVSNEAMLFQVNTYMVRKEYERCGYCATKRNQVPDDHVSLLCAFQAEVSGDAAKTLRQGDRVRLAGILRNAERFVTHHLANWVPEYARLLRRVDGALLYPQMVEALTGFIAQDLTFLSEASYWAERAQDWKSSSEQRELQLERTLNALRSIKQFGLEDFQLQRTTE